MDINDLIDIIASQTGFVLLLIIFGAGAISAVMLRKNDSVANIWSSSFSIAGSVYGIFFTTVSYFFNTDISFSFQNSMFPFLSLSFHVDTLSIFFIFVISLIALFCSIYGLGYVKHYYKKYDIGALGFFYNLFILGMLVVVTADNGMFFLVAWEIMSLASFFLVIYDHKDPDNIKAGYLYLVMTHVATAFIILAFLLIYKYTGTFDFERLRSDIFPIPPVVKNVVFILALVGFGTKAGIIPLHIWLPSAHPAAPSHVSALMSGVMIKTGIYMMIRMFLDILQPVPLWWGLTVLVIGSISSILGVLYALTEHDLKKLLACHSIENIGIILLGLGSALCFLSLGMPALSLLGFVAALFHTLNHATFKSLLFLSAGSVINETHTRNMEKYGGLIKYMPFTALFFLIGAMAISALPPFNGFFSEWLTFQSLFQGVAVIGISVKWVFIASAGALAFTGGLALACFVKAFGTTFLARPRSKKISNVKESSASLLIGMGALAALSLLIGLFSGPVTSILDGIGRELEPFRDTPNAIATSSFHGISIGNFSYVSAPVICVLFIVVFIVVLFAVHRLVNKSQKVRTGITWDCGSDLTPKMEINSTGFARSLITIFKGILKPSIQHETEYHDAESRYMPKSREVTFNMKDFHLSYLYTPLKKMFASLSIWAKTIQSGNINSYILYIFIALLAALTLVK
jgi:hydrogenase-4 component B